MIYNISPNLNSPIVGAAPLLQVPFPAAPRFQSPERDEFFFDDPRVERVMKIHWINNQISKSYKNKHGHVKCKIH